MYPIKNIIKLSDDKEFAKVVSESFSLNEIIRKFKLNVCGAQYYAAKYKIKNLNLDTSHFKKNIGSTAGLKILSLKWVPLSEILVENSTYQNMTSLKSRLIKENLFTKECAICKLTKWLGQPISLQLDHKNGINTDHRIDNLRLLCPNCHSQTENYAGRNKHKK